ncbi:MULTISPECIES: hypothetical protein [Planomicrobium]|uniref:Uncharacterized protein n=1 Tax=Planomicrobium okeanokoites TaxID=244 RepID=A0ABV7KKX0_PLAOK|nr:hypothetical protein [Planomicrobium sp. MB-3u-38]
MAADVKKKKERWWIVDLLIEAGELLFFIPRGIFRIIKDII